MTQRSLIVRNVGLWMACVAVIVGRAQTTAAEDGGSASELLGQRGPNMAFPSNAANRIDFERAKHEVRKQELLYGVNHANVGRALATLAELSLEGSGDLKVKSQEAEPIYERALMILEKTAAPDDHQLLTVMDGLAYIYSIQERYPEAEKLYRRVLPLKKVLANKENPTGRHPYDHSRDFAMTLYNLARNFHAQNRLVEADAFYQHALTVLQRDTGPDANVSRRLEEIVLTSYLTLLRRVSRTDEVRAMEARKERVREISRDR